MRGRKPLPANVHRLHGNPGKRPLNLEEFRPDVHIPRCPEHFPKGGEERREWNRISKLLAYYGLISDVDKAALAFYCTSWARYLEAEKMIKKAAEGGGSGLFVKSPNNFQVQSPWLAVSNRAMELCKTFLTEFGMTPSARTRVSPSTTQMQLPGMDQKEGFSAL